MGSVLEQKKESINKIILETKKEENIKLLKLRDELYEEAKFLNKLIFFIALIPIVYAIIIYNFDIDNYIINYLSKIGLDEIGVATSLFVSTIIYFISRKINSKKLNSNILRQAYDCKVLSIRGNKFIINEEIKIALEKMEITNEDKQRYEKWYGENFINNELYDILLCQIDNLLYTTYLYGALKKTLSKLLSTIIFIIILGAMYCIYIGKINNFIFGIIIPFSPIITVIITTWTKVEDNVDDYKNLINIIKDDIKNKKIDLIYLEAIQDKILINRLNDVLVPKKLREFYLKPNNGYKVALDDFKKWFKMWYLDTF